MGKKTLILSRKQIDEICGGDSSYLDGLALTPDMGNIYGNEVSAEGAVENGYAEPITTDDFSHDMTNNWRANAKLQGMGSNRGGGRGAISLEEMTLLEWKKKNLTEEKEHGNARLQHMQFGAKDGEKGKGYDATKMNLSRYNAAETKSRSTNPSIKQQGLSTMATMEKNWPGIKAAQTQYKAAKQNDKTIQQNRPEGAVIASSPKQTGNGMGHSNGVITK